MGLTATYPLLRTSTGNVNLSLALDDKKFKKRLSDSGYEPMLGLGPEKAKRYIGEEYVRWTPILKSIGTKE